MGFQGFNRWIEEGMKRRWRGLSAAFGVTFLILGLIMIAMVISIIVLYSSVEKSSSILAFEVKGSNLFSLVIEYDVLLSPADLSIDYCGSEAYE